MDTFGTLARVLLTTSWQDIYTCPVLTEQTYESATVSVRAKSVDRPTSTLVSSVVVCRLAGTAGAANWFSMAIVDAAGATPVNADYLFFENPVNGGLTKVLGLGVTLSAGQTIRARAEANTAISMVVNGVEVR